LSDEIAIQLEGSDDVDKKIFDACQEAVYSMLEFDSFRKFLTSDLYKSYLGSFSSLKPTP
jgi:hypothetical protein